jgi:hypothetical protein
MNHNQTPLATPAYTRDGNNILADALEALDLEDQKTIRTLLRPNTTGVEAALDEVHAYAKELQQRCANRRWCWSYQGQQVYLDDQANKVLQLLDRLESAGDVVAGVDPIHVGLPWAGIRVILRVCICRRNVTPWVCTDRVGQGRLERQRAASCLDHRNGALLLYE